MGFGGIGMCDGQGYICILRSRKVKKREMGDWGWSLVFN